jgi:hypothetical protein
MAETGPLGAAWRVSSYSGQNGACIEIAASAAGVVAVRDSKDRDGPVLVFAPDEWLVFTAQIRAES